jgi:3-hydroxyisobutyrate dehydrogenase/2-hydroxy-3-oxopropionate reductase
MGVLGESLALAEGLGLSRQVVFEVLARTPLAAQAKRRRPAIERNDYPLRFALSLARKDANLIIEAAEATGVDMRLLSAARSWFIDAEEAGHGNQDYSTVLAHILTK